MGGLTQARRRRRLDREQQARRDALAAAADDIAVSEGLGAAILALRQVQLDVARAWKAAGRAMNGWIA